MRGKKIQKDIQITLIIVYNMLYIHIHTQSILCT